MKKQISEANHDSSNQLGSSNQHRGRKRLAFGVTLGSLLALAPTAHGYQLDSVEVALPNEAAVVLSTDVYRPDVEDPAGRPTILRRGPYGKQNNISTGDVTHIVDVLGYNLVVQDVRGRWDSTGEYLPFLNAREDGAYMVDWIVGHSWSDGQVATSGVSALGITQYMMASEASDAWRPRVSGLGRAARPRSPSLGPLPPALRGAPRRGAGPIAAWLDTGSHRAPRRPS